MSTFLIFTLKCKQSNYKIISPPNKKHSVSELRYAGYDTITKHGEHVYVTPEFAIPTVGLYCPESKYDSEI